MRISRLCIHDCLSSGLPVNIYIYKILQEDRVLFIGRCEKVHPRVLKALADDSESANPPENILLATIESNELKEAPQKDTLSALDKMWSYCVLEIAYAMVWISQSISVQKGFVDRCVSFKSVL